MRVEPYSIGSVVHVIKRGTRGMDIVKDQSDRWRFMRQLYLLNDEFQDTSRTHRVSEKIFERPLHWPDQKPLTSILGWTLMPNHFHLLMYETKEGGISKFMQRLGGSMTTHFNEKYQVQGSLFQGAYKSRTIDTDSYLQYVYSYIVVKNVFELYPGGLGKAVKEFDTAWEWAKEYLFSSFRSTANGVPSPIIDANRVHELGLPSANFKEAAKNMFFSHIEKREELQHLYIEPW